MPSPYAAPEAYHINIQEYGHNWINHASGRLTIIPFVLPQDSFFFLWLFSVFWLRLHHHILCPQYFLTPALLGSFPTCYYQKRRHLHLLSILGKGVKMGGVNSSIVRSGYQPFDDGGILFFIHITFPSLCHWALLVTTSHILLLCRYGMIQFISVVLSQRLLFSIRPFLEGRFYPLCPAWAGRVT